MIQQRIRDGIMMSADTHTHTHTHTYTHRDHSA